MKVTQIVVAIFTGAILSCTTLAQQPAPPQSSDQTRPEGPWAGGAEGRRFQGTGGQITAISGDTIKLKTPRGTESTVRITGDTQFRRDRNSAKLQDFKVGDYVMVRGNSTGENQWTAQMVATRSDAQQQLRGEMGKNFVVGEVKALDPPKVTILRPDGVTQIIEADENTSLKKGGESIIMADIQPGDRLFARGEVKNGTFVPVMIMVGTPGQMRYMMNGPGSGGDQDRRQESKDARGSSSPK